MANDSSGKVNLGCGFIIFIILLVVQTVFVTLRLAEVGNIATWSWGKTLIPLWIALANEGLQFIIGFIIGYSKVRNGKK